MVKRTPWALVAWAGVSGRGAFLQNSDEVFVREPGYRLLEGPREVAVEAAKHWEFAWLSQAAYAAVNRFSRDVSAQNIVVSKAADEAFLQAGWVRWSDFPSIEAARRITKPNVLYVEIWEKKKPPSIAVAFGGTFLTSGKDWKANFRWFLPFHNDDYTLTVQALGPAFLSAFSRRANEPGGAYLREATIYATGHSLGGGLAQQFAYSMPIDASVPRVTHVYAFDPSPVTGFFSVNRRTRDINKKGLLIDRIYERGEILAILRSFTSLISPPSASNPRIRAVRYSLFYPVNPFSGHSMLEFASKLHVAAGQVHGD